MDTYTIDAKNKKLGRVATEAATALMGKHLPAFRRHIFADVQVVITNVGELSIDERKKEGKIYTRYSGYPGGKKDMTMGEVIDKKGFSEVMRKAVKGMLPKNKLQAKMMKCLTIEE